MSTHFLQESHTLNSPFLKTYPRSKSYSWLSVLRICGWIRHDPNCGFVTAPHGEPHAVCEGLRNTSPAMKTASKKSDQLSFHVRFSRPPNLSVHVAGILHCTIHLEF